MGKKRKRADERIKYKLNDFFINKLDFRNNILYFGSDNKFLDVVKLINFDIRKAKKILGLNLTKEKIEEFILNDNQIAELAFAKNIDFIKVDDVSEFNILRKINYLLKEAIWKENNIEIINRPPIVTIMGHVDHGKTTLLDTIRKSNLVKKEVGGITQSIGAYQIEYEGKKITFIDTPGHEAFTKMRAHGSKLTDIAIIVVSADDSIMPQTREAIELAKVANVPIIIAINKIDKIGVNVEKVINELSANFDLIPNFWGGNINFIEISALKNLNIDKLLQAVLSVSDKLNLKTPLNVLGSGTIIETNISKERGNLTNAIVLNGTIKSNDGILIDEHYVRIKALMDENGKNIDKAYPGQPIEIYGLGFSPKVGTNFVVSNEKNTQKIASKIKERRKAYEYSTREITDPFLIFKDSTLFNKKNLKIILKADKSGILNALSEKIESFSNEELEIKVIRKEIGPINHVDISLAETSGAIVYQFNLKIPSTLLQIIKTKNIHIENFDIIYKLLENVELKIAAQKPKHFRQEKIGEAVVLQKFTISKLGTVAGCKVISGKINTNSHVKIYRRGKFIEEKKISSLKILKDNVKIVKFNQECGIMLEGYDDFEVDDRFEIFELVSI